MGTGNFVEYLSDFPPWITFSGCDIAWFRLDNEFGETGDKVVRIRDTCALAKS